MGGKWGRRKKKHSSSSCFPSSLSFSSICSGKVANPSIIAPPFLNTWACGNLRATYLFRLPKITYIQHHSSFPGPIFSCGAHSYTVGVLNLGHSVRLLADASNLWWIVQTHIFAGGPTISLGRVCAPCTATAAQAANQTFGPLPHVILHVLILFPVCLRLHCQNYDVMRGGGKVRLLSFFLRVSHDDRCHNLMFSTEVDPKNLFCPA